MKKIELNYTINFEVWCIERYMDDPKAGHSVYFMAASESNNISQGIAKHLYNDRNKSDGDTNYSFVVYSVNRKDNYAPSGVYMTPLTKDTEKEMKNLIAMVEKERVFQ